MNKIIILAAGKGTRMDSELPKVLVPLHGRAMITYLMDSIKNSGVDDKPIIVMSPDNQAQISKALKGYSFEVVLQEEQLGTGHALSCAQERLRKDYDHVIVFYGDHPFVQPTTINRLIDSHEHTQYPIAMMTTCLDSFDGWQKTFKAWGRIIRDKDHITNIVEFKDATEAQKEIKEVNPGFYCFKSDWLWDNISKLQNNNNQKEYYLTDLIHIATQQGFSIHDIPVESWETIGVNSKEELRLAEALFQDKL